MTIAAHRDERVIERGAAALDEMRDACRSLVYAALVTDDGFEIVHIDGSQTDHGRFASMSSSVQALSDAVARELKIGESRYVIIAAEHGHVIQLRVPGQPIVLAALFGNEETLGKALSIARLTSQSLASDLASHPASVGS